MKRAALLALCLAVLVVAAVSGYTVYRVSAAGNTQTSTLAGYSIAIQPLNSSRTVAAGSTAVFLFNVTSPMVGPLYFYASDIPAPGAHWMMNINNVTQNSIELPQGVQVSYPTGQAVFGTNHAILTLMVTFSPTLNGTLGLTVGAYQQVSQTQVVGYGSGFYVTVHQA